MIDRKNFVILIVIISVLVTVYGCSVLFSGDHRPTKIVASPFGMTHRVVMFKAYDQKPAGHVIWGNDVNDGADCSIVIMNVSLGKPVFTYNFIYKRETAGTGYNFPGGTILEEDPFWYRKVGRYVVSLYVDEQRVSTDTFDIVP